MANLIKSCAAMKNAGYYEKEVICCDFWVMKRSNVVIWCGIVNCCEIDDVWVTVIRILMRVI